MTNSQQSWFRRLAVHPRVMKVMTRVARNRHLFIKHSRVARLDYLDLGCGPNHHDDVINLDFGWRPEIDICWDVTRRLPLRDASLKGIFSEHCFEHLPAASIGAVLSECYRVMAPGGHIRIVMPDGELYLTRYADVVRGNRELTLPYSENHELDGIRSPIVTVNRIFRHHGHQYIYDFDVLRQLLGQAGFVDVAKEVFGAGRDPRLLLDSEHRAIESLYVEATKPPVH